MADGSTRSVAEKLAAAKKKHKAYLKEKVLKSNVNNDKDTHTGNSVIQPIGTMLDANQISEYERNLSSNVNNTNNVDIQADAAYSNPLETDFPLPQYSMDYNNQHQGNSLPDPLSFFDNFSSVGATFQNFTQPLASFFNNSRNSPVNETVELPNQILVEENSVCPVNFDRKPPITDTVLPNTVGQEVFSYDRFKSNAISNVPTENSKNEEIKSSFEAEQFSENQIFDNFTNSSSVKTDNQNTYIFNQEKLADTFHNKVETHAFVNKPESSSGNSRNSADLFQSAQERVPVMFEMKPEIVAYSNDKNIHSENLQVNENQLSQNDNIGTIQNNQSFNFQTLQRISNEMDELIKDEENSPYQSTATVDEKLEQRNIELLELLDCQSSKYAKLSSQLQESEIKHSKLLTDYRILEIQKEDSETDLRLKVDIEIQNELSKLREDLQCHLQTIGLLVAEKTELSALLNETQLSLRNESSQRMDIENKMKGLIAFYSNLQNELESLKSEKMNLNSSQNEQTEVFNKMREDHNELKHQHDEIMQDLLESKEKLKSTAESNATLQKHVQDLSGQLSLANIKIQQLTLGEAMQQESELDKLMQEKFAYEKQISFLSDTLKTITKEREESSMQYQMYAEQLNVQITNLAAKLVQYQKENEQLRTQDENRIKHIGNLEKQLQNLQNDNSAFNLQRNNSMLKKELEATKEMTELFKSEKEALNVSLTKALVEKELLEKDLDSCKVSIGQFESTVEQLRGSQPNNAILLATMESDKVAASRAISQNNELKKQMDGMQEVLLKVNNDNVQLTENVSLERRTNKDLFEKLQRTEISLQTLAEAIEIKDKELVNLREELERTTRRIAHQEQLSDRLRHYEAQDYGSSSLQNELQDAKHMIAHLTNELNTLKKNQLNQTHQMNQTVEIDQMHQNTQTAQNQSGDEVIPANPEMVDELKTQLNHLQVRNKELESLSQNLSLSKETKSTDANGNESLDKETAMRHLEKKFLRTMEEIARLTEEKQRLEHLVLQLQGETETIGEYVTLYQQQRSILKQRALEKDQQLQQLTNDRETIKANLDRLNSLVNKLIVEKGAITKELMEQHEHFSRERDDLCEEHQKIHHEINKITSDRFRNSGVTDNANTEVAEEIISLLSEIKSSNLVQPAEGIHHCPWCSGKLITV